MSAHLAHKILWESLADLYVYKQELRNTEWTPAQEKKLDHIGRVLALTLQDFNATANPSLQEQGELDPRTWGIHLERSTGYYDGLISGYMALNILLADPVRIEQLHADRKGTIPYFFEILFGINDGSHPPHMVVKLTPAFDGIRLKPLTTEVLQILRDHAALLFRCMYIMAGENKFLDEERVIRWVYHFFY